MSDPVGLVSARLSVGGFRSAGLGLRAGGAALRVMQPAAAGATGAATVGRGWTGLANELAELRREAVEKKMTSSSESSSSDSR